MMSSLNTITRQPFSCMSVRRSPTPDWSPSATPTLTPLLPGDWPTYSDTYHPTPRGPIPSPTLGDWPNYWDTYPPLAGEWLTNLVRHLPTHPHSSQAVVEQPGETYTPTPTPETPISRPLGMMYQPCDTPTHPCPSKGVMNLPSETLTHPHHYLYTIYGKNCWVWYGHSGSKSTNWSVLRTDNKCIVRGRKYTLVCMQVCPCLRHAVTKQLLVYPSFWECFLAGPVTWRHFFLKDGFNRDGNKFSNFLSLKARVITWFVWCDSNLFRQY